ncbi:hypothetical protein [Methanosarcina lacustris]|nr:hypothetical protein [Methanosarcina lacustris]
MLDAEEKKWLFGVLCGYPHKNQCGLELKIILSIENDEEPNKIFHLRIF